MTNRPNLEGAPGGSGQPRPRLTLTGGGAVAVQNGGSASVHFTVARSFTSTAVTFATENLPPGVTGQFTPASLPSGSGGASVTLHLTAAPAALAAQTTITLVASATNVTASLLVALTVVSPFSQIAGAPMVPVPAVGEAPTVAFPLNVTLFPSSQAVIGMNLQFPAETLGTVTFVMVNLPTGVTAQFQPAGLSAPGLAGPVAVQIVLSAAANAPLTPRTPMSPVVTAGVLVDGQPKGRLNINLQVIAPASGSNYFFANSCQPLTDVSVTVAITQALVAAPPLADQQHGFSFQFNCSSAPNASNPNLIVWQQYIVGVGSGKVRAAVNNWTNTELLPGEHEQSINPVAILSTQPLPDMLPAGFSVTIALQNDAQGNVTGVRFTTGSGDVQSFTLTELTKTNGQPVTADDLAPIVAFELNIVGPGDIKNTTFTSGAGTITYRAASPLQPLAILPLCVANRATTGETANSAYGLLPTTAGQPITQSFSLALVSVPQLIGLAPDAVRTALEAANLLPLEETKTVPSATAKPAICIAQEPSAGTQVTSGRSIRYTIEQFLVGGHPPGKP